MAKKIERLPEFTCASCNHCRSRHCRIYARPVDTGFNKCFNHSKYRPEAAPFKVQKGLEALMQQEKAAEEKHYKGWLAEDEKIRQAIRQEIEKKRSSIKNAESN